MEDKIPLYLFAGCLVFFVACNLFSVARALNFYRRNGWDFSKDFGSNIYWGDMPDEDAKMSPRAKLLIGYPALILGCTLTLVGMAALGNF
jgi:hypothetical protein